MRPLLVVPRQIVSDRLPCLADGLIGLQIYLFVLHAAPQPFDKNVVSPASLAVHRQSDPTRADRVGEVCTGELGGFNRSSQHWIIEQILGTRPRLPQASSSRGIFGALRSTC